MTDQKPIIDIMEGVGALLALVGIPVAAIIPGVSSILNGIFGLRSKKK